MQDRRVEAGRAEHPAHPVPLTVHRRIDHPRVARQVPELDHPAAGGRMVAGERDELRLPVHENAPLQPVGHGERGTLHLVHEGDVQPARLHRTQQGVGGHVDAQRDVGAGQGDAQPAQPAADDPARGGADPQPGAAGPRGLRLRERVADQVVHALDEGAGPVEDGAPQGGGPAAGPLAPEQFGAQDVLDPPQLGGERGLAHAEPAGRLVQAARVGDGAQRPEVSHLQLHAAETRPGAHHAPDAATPPKRVNSGSVGPGRKWRCDVYDVDMT